MRKRDSTIGDFLCVWFIAIVGWCHSIIVPLMLMFYGLYLEAGLVWLSWFIGTLLGDSKID